jgi:predicted DNA-binding protein
VEATINFRLPAEEKSLIQSYAKFHGISVAAAVRSAIIERIEDDEDMRDYEVAMANPNPEFYTMEEIKQMYGIE